MTDLLFMVDEGQKLFAREGISSKILLLRHARVHLIANFQNASKCPVELKGNSTVVAFQLTDKADQDAFASSAGLRTVEQKAELGRLDVAQCVCRLPQSEWKSPFIATVPRIEFDDANVDIEAESKHFLSQFEWTPLEEDEPVDGAVGTGMDVQMERFLRDVLNQAHEASALTARFERAGIRSASKQGQVIRKLCADGYIKIFALAVGRGRPLKLVEPTVKAREEFGVRWKKTTRGTLPVRVATTLLEKKFTKLEGWTCIREGTLSYED